MILWGKRIKQCIGLNYFQHFLLFACAVRSFVSISAFASLVGVPVGITSPSIGLKIYALIAWIKKKKHSQSSKKKNKKPDKTAFLATKLINSYIYHNKFASVHNV